MGSSKEITSLDKIILKFAEYIHTYILFSAPYVAGLGELGLGF